MKLREELEELNQDALVNILIWNSSEGFAFLIKPAGMAIKSLDPRILDLEVDLTSKYKYGDHIIHDMVIFP